MMNRDMLRQAQKLQERLAKAQQELADITVEGTAGGGAVTVVMTADQKLKSVKISPEAVSGGDAEMLEDLVMAAVNEGLQKAQEAASKHLSAVTGGLRIPGLM